MKVSKRKRASRELLVLGAIISSSKVLRSLAEWKRGHSDSVFQIKSLDLLVDWCIEHWKEKGEAPGDDVIVTHYYEPWEEKTGGGSFAEEVDDIRVSAIEAWNSAKYKEHQLFDLVEKVLRRQQVLVAMEMVDGNSNAEVITDIYPGAEVFSLTREPEYPSFFENPKVGSDIKKISESIVQFKDPILAKFFGNSLGRATFSTFQAPEKRGKSQWLVEIAIAGLASGLKVLFIDAGDMTEDQIFLRFIARAANRPIEADSRKLEWKTLEAYSATEVIAEYQEVHYTEPLPQAKANELKAKYYKALKGKFFTRNFPKSSLTISTIRSILDSMADRGHQIDLLIVDYADILAPSKSKYQDNRHAITEIWGDMRALSQTYDLCLLTATQADADSYNNEQHQGSFSESKTKNAFITAEYAIDKTPYDPNVYKLKYLFRRSGSLGHSILVGSDLATTHPAMKTCWVPKAKDKERQPVGKIKR